MVPRGSSCPTGPNQKSALTVQGRGGSGSASRCWSCSCLVLGSCPLLAHPGLPGTYGKVLWSCTQYCTLYLVCSSLVLPWFVPALSLSLRAARCPLPATAAAVCCCRLAVVGPCCLFSSIKCPHSHPSRGQPPSSPITIASCTPAHPFPPYA